MAKIAWHTDIVVGGQGMNVKIVRQGTGCATLIVKPDVPGKASKKQLTRFMKEIPGKTCSTSTTKKAVEGAIRKTKARWNKWHHEAY